MNVNYVKYKYVNLTAILLLFSGLESTTFAQTLPVSPTTWPLKGFIGLLPNESALGQPVMLYRDTTKLKIVGTDEAGRFSFGLLPEGRYELRAVRLGYEPLRVTVLHDAMTPPVSLSFVAKVTTLEEVVVRQKKPDYEFKHDRIVVNVESNPIFSGGTIVDVLGATPRIAIDVIGKTIALDGLQTLTVYLNDKQVVLPPGGLMNYLQSQPAGGFSRVEMLTSPSARYDAAGGGVLLLYTKRPPTEGVSLDWSLTGGFGRSEKANGSVNANVNLNRLTGFLMVSGIHRPMYFGYTSDQVIGRATGDNGFTHSVQQRTVNTQSYSYQSGVDYSLSKRVFIGASLQGGNQSVLERPTADVVYALRAATPVTAITSASRFDQQRSNVSANANIRVKTGREGLLSTDIDFARFIGSSVSATDFSQTRPTRQATESLSVDYPNQVTIGTVKSDYSVKIGTLKLETGVKYSAITMVNQPSLKGATPAFLGLVGLLTKPFTYDEQTFAGYASTAFEVHKWAVSAGLRLEDTHYTGVSSDVSVQKHYVGLFPSLAVSRTTAQKYQFSGSINRRIVRPTFDYLNPAYVVFDPLTLVSGNPFLRPQLVTVYQLGLQTPRRYSVTLTHSESRQRITEVLYRSDTSSGRLTNTFINFNRETRTGLVAIFPFQVSKTWQLQLSLGGAFNAYYSTFGDQLTRVSMFTPSFRINNSLTLRKWTFSLNASGRGRAVVGFLQYKPLAFMDMALQRQFNPRSSLKVALSDVFHSIKSRNQGSYLNTVVSFNHAYESRQLLVTYSYRVGNLKVKTNARRGVGSESEQERAKKE